MVHHTCHDHEPFVTAQVQNFAAQETINSKSWVRNTLAILDLIVMRSTLFFFCFFFVFLLQFHLESLDDDVLDYGILSDSDVVNKTFILYNPNPIRVSTRM